MKSFLVNTCAIVARFMAVFFVLLAYQLPAQEVVGAKNGLLADPSIYQMDHVSVKVMGTAESPVFLITGLSSPRATWDGIAPELAKTHRVFLVQVNGFGGDAPGANLKLGILTGMVDDLDAFIRNRRLTSSFETWRLENSIPKNFASELRDEWSEPVDKCVNNHRKRNVPISGSAP